LAFDISTSTPPSSSAISPTLEHELSDAFSTLFYYSTTDSDVDSPPPTPPKQPFFFVSMLNLGDRPRHPGCILSVHTLINITKVATKDLQTACVANAIMNDIVGASIARLSTLASKLLQHFWGLTGLDRGWLDGLEHPKYDDLFTGTCGVHAIANGLLSQWEAQGNACSW
jgi:hypothetical protein